MRMLRHILLPGLVAVSACKSRNDESSSAKDAAAAQPAALGEISTPVDIQSFRAMFLSAVRTTHGDNYIGLAKNFLIYAPPPDLLAEPNAQTPEDFLTAVRATTKPHTPPELFANGRESNTFLTRNGALDEALTAYRTAQGEPLMIVIVPGVFGEFIDARAFDEIYRAQSSFQKAWRAANPAGVSDLSNGAPVTLDHLMTAGSIDDAQGKSLVDVMIFETPRLSTESLGPQATLAKIFSRRLDMAFARLGRVPKNIALLGYSRGMPVGLEMLAKGALANQADPAAEPWVKNVRAMVSLGGVLYGSDLADAATSGSSVTGQELAAVEALNAALDDANGWAQLSAWQKTQLAARNVQAWAAFIHRLASLSAPDLSNTSITDLVKNITSITQRLARIDYQPSLRMLSLFWSSFHLSDPVGDNYPANVARFKQLSKAVLIAVRELSRTERLKWWSTNVVPTDGVHYYALTSTLSDQKPLLNNPYTGIPNGEDDTELLSGYVNYRQVSGLALNDSQVSYDVARFWPKLATLLNPAQPPMTTTYLGMLGASHWALALPEVNRQTSGQKNPFPRVELLRAIATTIAVDR